MNNELLKVSLRYKALFLGTPAEDLQSPSPAKGDLQSPFPAKGDLQSPPPHLSAPTLALLTELHTLGYGVSEELLHALNTLDADERQTLIDVMNDVMGTHLNWASLTRGWLVPTGETIWDHFLTLMANIQSAAAPPVADGLPVSAAVNADLQSPPGTRLPCGHLIPDGTFDLARYNGCPFCGTPFRTADWTYRGQGTKLRQLQLWTDADLRQLLTDLLLSPVPLDATQRDSLKVMLRHYGLPDGADIKMKETRMLVVDCLLEEREERGQTGDEGDGIDREAQAGSLLATPTDVLRYLWYRHTGHIQLIEPRTLLHIKRKNQRYERNSTDDIDRAADEERQRLKLKYSRTWCRRVARWLNTQPTTLNAQLESMHPKREMWVRMIRALRLAEYARRPGYEHLRELMDRFYRKDYEVFQGRVDHYRLKNDATETLRLLRQRPGLFARCLFSTMLTFGRQPVIAAFREVLPQVPVRLLLSLGSQAENYFDRHAQRIARPLSGVQKLIPPHPLLKHYTDDELAAMRRDVNALYLDAMRRHFALPPSPFPTIYIAPELDDIPVAVGDRSATIQDTSCALQGTRFRVDGDAVRLFLQWGVGLPAQHLDMDLSCYLLKGVEELGSRGVEELGSRGAEDSPEGAIDLRRGCKPPTGAIDLRRGCKPPTGAAKSSDSQMPEVCAYFNLSPEGCRHSGDIQHIPDQVGTAEYVELQLPVLQARGIERVVFTCNAYTAGELSPNLMVGWMSAEQPMQVSNETGVAYDPSTVQHMVRIAENNLSKGLIFGVLDVSERVITWLEMPFDGQTVLSVSAETVDAYLRRLRAKPTIGQVLRIKAEVQGLTLVDSPDDATEAYTLLWAQNTAAVSRLLM